MEQKTKKEIKKEKRERLLTLAKEIENLINQSTTIPGEVKEALLFSVAEMKRVAKSYAEALRRAEVCCFCGKSDESDSLYKRLLYDELKKIWE